MGLEESFIIEGRPNEEVCMERPGGGSPGPVLIAMQVAGNSAGISSGFEDVEEI